MVFLRKSLLDTLMQSFIMLWHLVAEISRFKFDDCRVIRTGASDLRLFGRCKYETSMSIPCELPIKICRWFLMKSISEGLSVHPWWRHQMETIFVLLAPCPENPPVIAGFPSEGPVTLGFDILFDLLEQTNGTPVIWDAIVLIMTLLTPQLIWLTSVSVASQNFADASLLHTKYSCHLSLRIALSRQLYNTLWYLLLQGAWRDALKQW